MSTTTVTPEGIDQYGRFTIVRRTMNDDGLVIDVHRQQVQPGSWNNGSWVDTDTTSFGAVVQAFVAEHWTADVITAYKAAFPYVAPPPPTAGQVRDTAFKADPARIDLMDRLKNATPQQIETWMTNNVTNLAQARGMLTALVKVLAIVVRD